MTRQEFLRKSQLFFNKWLNRSDDYDGVYPGECVDTAKRFMNEVCGIKDVPATGNGWASGYWINRNSIPQIKRNFNFITTPNKLETGDIVITAHPHVAIYNAGKLFGQNHGGKHEPNSNVSFSLFASKFLGALRLKTSDETKSEDPYYKCALDVIKGRYGNGHDTRANAIYSKVRQEVNGYFNTNKKISNTYIGEIAKDVINGAHGNGHYYRKTSIYKRVREEVNRIV